jgi:hypothetical protein
MPTLSPRRVIGALFGRRASASSGATVERRLALCACLMIWLGALALSQPARGAIVHEYLGSEEPSSYTPFPGAGSTVVRDESTSLTDWAKGDTYERVGPKPSEHYAGSAFDVFTPSHELVGELKIPGTEGYGNSVGVYELAIDDATGDAIVTGQVPEPRGVFGIYGELFFEHEVLEVFEPTLAGHWAPPRQLTRDVSHPEGAIGVDESEGVPGAGEFYVGTTFPRQRVEEYSPAGVYLGAIPGACKSAGERPPCREGDLVPFTHPASVSVDPATHDLYVLDAATHELVDIFGPDIVVPDVSTGATSHLTGTSVILTGTVNPDSEGPATCRFAWGTTKGFGHTVACSAEVAEGDSPVPVDSVKLEGLTPDTEYCYRLQAENAAKGANSGGLSAGEESEDRCFTTAGLEANPEWTSDVSAEAATFDATINPRGVPTDYYFEYGSSSSYSSVLPASPGASTGPAEGAINVSQHVQGLAPGMLYHYRVVATIEPEPGHREEFDGPDQTFTTQLAGPGFRLPDGRQYVLVSPPQTLGALFKGAPLSESELPDRYENRLLQASAAGNAFVDEATQPTSSETAGDANGVAVFMTRGAGGWSSEDVAAPHLHAAGISLNVQEYQIFSEDLSRAAFEQWGDFTALAPEAAESTPYLRTMYFNGNVAERCTAPNTSAESCFAPLVTRANTQPGTSFGDASFDGECGDSDCGPQFLAGTPDLTHILIASREQLTATPVKIGRIKAGQDPAGLPEAAVYEWYGGSLRLVNILPGQNEGGGAEIAWRHGNHQHLLSADGRFAILEGVTEEHATNMLYLRDLAKEETISLGSGGQYETANSRDTRVFFLSHGQTPNSSPGTDLYECAVIEEAGRDQCDLTDLTPETDSQASEVISVLGASEDGSYVYFVASGALATGAVAGAPNVYVRHEGTTKFIAGISERDASLYDNSDGGGEEYQQLRARVSPNGSWVAFMSDRPLTGYDNRDSVNGSRDEEVYLYDAEAGTLDCASCKPTGARPDGSEYVVAGVASDFAATLPEWVSNNINQKRLLYQPRYLSDSGRLFFDSADSLVPDDVNGVYDVYEYEPAGVPAGARACAASSATASVVFKPAKPFETNGVAGEESAGCVALISSGTSAQPSTFLDASETGGDVFFLSTSRLSAAAIEGGLSIYDAQECTSTVPCPPMAAAPPPECDTAASCRPATTPQPEVFGAPASATFFGSGNVSPSPSTASSSQAKPKPRTPAQIRAQQLAATLKSCRRKHGRSRRSACERLARTRYGARDSGRVSVAKSAPAARRTGR